MPASLDALLVLTLLFSGWSLEWTYRADLEWRPFVVYYARLAAPALFFFLYLATRGHGSPTSRGGAGLSALRWLCVAFAVTVLAERIQNGFADTWLNWKAYYYLCLLPFWWWLGFDIGGDGRRVERLFWWLAALGGAACLYSLLLSILGVLVESPIGPMYWPYRFLVILGFMYCVSVFVTGARRNWTIIVMGISCSVAVFNGFYKFTIVSTLLGLTVWGAFLFVKGGGHRLRHLSILGAVVLGAGFSVILVNRLSGGSLLDSATATVQDRWLHNVTQFESPSIELLNALSGERFRIWEELAARIRARPVLGAGLGQSWEEGIVSHNGYLDLLLSFGFVGGGLFLAALAVWLLALWRSRPTGMVLAVQLTCVGYVATVLAANLFGSVWAQFQTVSAYLMITAGISSRLCRDDTSVSRTTA